MYFALIMSFHLSLMSQRGGCVESIGGSSRILVPSRTLKLGLGLLVNKSRDSSPALKRLAVVDELGEVM